MTIIIDGTVGANKAVVLDSSGKLPAIDGSLVTTLNATQVTTGSIATARIDTGTTNGKVLVLDGSGNMPAIAAGSMTGVESATKSASDPTISTNPATGLGTKWINTTSGEIFILTDATAGENVWTSTGGTSGNVQPFNFPGSSYGYITGGTLPTSNVIEKVSFTTDGNATDVGDMTQSRGESSGCSSATHGYTTGGYPPGPASNVIERFPFATDTNATDVGDLTSTRRDVGTTSSETHGFVHSGQSVNTIERWIYAASANSVDVGDLTIAVGGSDGSSDPDGGYGYSHGGWYNSAKSNVIERYAFAASANGSDVGDLAFASGQVGSNSSLTHGYSHGTGEASIGNYIQKFAFAASATGTDVGDLTTNVFVSCGVSATSYSYRMGGCNPNGGVGVNTIDKWPHASDTNATDVGDLTITHGYCGPSGCQY